MSKENQNVKNLISSSKGQKMLEILNENKKLKVLVKHKEKMIQKEKEKLVKVKKN